MKIPSAWQAAKEALRFGWTHFGQIFKCALVPILAAFAVGLVIEHGRIESGMDMLMALYLLALVFFVSIQFHIKVFRLFVYNEAPQSLFSLEEMFSPRVGRFLLYFLLLSLLSALAFGVFLFLPIGLAALTKTKALAIAGPVLGLPASLYLVLGLSFVIPGIYLDVPVGIKRSLALTRGIKLKILFSKLLLLIPLSVVSLTPFVLIFGLAALKVPPMDPASAAAGLGPSSTGFVSAAVSFVMITIYMLGEMVSWLPILVLFKAKAMAPEPAPAVHAP